MKKFIFAIIICITCFTEAELRSTINNGHELEKLKEDDIYIGQSLTELISILGKPFFLLDNKKKAYFFFLKRVINPIPLLGGYIQKGIILIIDLDDNSNVVSYEFKKYKHYKSKLNINKRMKELDKEKTKREKAIKEIDDKNKQKYLDQKRRNKKDNKKKQK